MGKHGRGGTIPDQLPKATDIVWVANAPDQAGDPLHIHRPDHRRNRPVSTRGCPAAADRRRWHLADRLGRWRVRLGDPRPAVAVPIGPHRQRRLRLDRSAVLSDNAVLDGPGTTTLAAGSDAVTNGLILDNGRRLLVQEPDPQRLLRLPLLRNGAVIENAGRFTVATECDTKVLSDGTDGSAWAMPRAGCPSARQRPTGTSSRRRTFEWRLAGAEPRDVRARRLRRGAAAARRIRAGECRQLRRWPSQPVRRRHDGGVLLRRQGQRQQHLADLVCRRPPGGVRLRVHEPGRPTTTPSATSTPRRWGNDPLTRTWTRLAR